MRVLYILCFVLAFVAGTPSPAAAADVSSAAELKARADRAMDRGEFAQALSAYRQAYAESPSPALLYNMGRAQEKLGNYPEALGDLESFEETATADLKAKVPRLHALIERLRARVARVEVKSNVPGALVVVRGQLRGTAASSRPIAVLPGRATVELTADGYVPVRRDVVLAEGSLQRLDFTLTKKPNGVLASVTSGDAPRSASEPITKQWWFWTGVGVVVVAGTATTVALLTERSAPRGDIAPHQVSAPLLRF